MKGALEAISDKRAEERIESLLTGNEPQTSRTLKSALGELRGIVGIHIALMAARYGLDVQGDLAAILPAEVDNQEV